MSAWNWLVILAAFVFVAAILLVGFGGRAGVAAPDQQVGQLPSGQDVWLPVSMFDDGQARFFSYTTSAGNEIRLFLVKGSDGVLRAAFDACDVCFPEKKGYRQAGALMVCNACGQSVSTDDVNRLEGGCNPAPIDRAFERDHVLLRAADLDRGVTYF
jgi:uncharacterized membrane protein